MKLNNKGFALTSIIYMLIVLFLMILLLILANLAQRKVVLDKIKNDVKTNLNQGGLIAKNTYTVTFNPTIGQINQTSKQVTYNEPYGELPTPTREGYKFIGWRGKNLFTGLVKGVGLSSADGHQGTDNKMATSDYIPVDFTNEGYYLNGLSSNLRNFVAFYNENKEFMGRTNGVIVQNRYLVDNSSITNSATGVGGNISYIRITIYELDGYTTGTIDDIDNLNIQLEQGNIATSYEPYQEYTSDTIVTKRENHTLYAMWEPLYTVTFDSNGGTLTENTKYVAYNEPYGELPTPTREGYKFVGWAKQTYDTYNFIKYYDESNVLRISPDANYQSSENQIIEDRDILIFDVSFSDSTIRSIEIDDKVLDSSKYSSENGRVYGKINIEEAMLKSETYFFNFIDVNFNEKPTTYTINKFILIKHDDISTPQTIVTKQENHTLYAIWEPNE